MWNGRYGDSDLARFLDSEFHVSGSRCSVETETKNLRPETQERLLNGPHHFASHLVHPLR